MKIEKSTCGKFIRISIDGIVHEMTMSEWAHAIANPGTFRKK